jgi:hypothetical protein
MIARRGPTAFAALAIAVGACSGSSDAPNDPCVGPPGLYEDGHCGVTSRDLRAYTPSYTLWADGAEKQRLVRLPEGTIIDGTDPDNWIFPVGTTLYKTFSLAGVRLETRVLQKVGPGNGVDAWSMKTYAWNAAQNAVKDVTSDDGCPECAALRNNVLGTNHDIPDGGECRQCHRGSIDTVNGFGAMQLNHAGPGVTLQGLLDEGRLRTTPTIVADAVFPGDDLTRDSLGYLNANCGHCHRYDTVHGPSACQTTACLSGLLLWTPVATKSFADSAVNQTAVAHRALFTGFAPAVTCRILPGSPDDSVLVRRMESRNDVAAMPRIASKIVDADGLARIRAFIAAMPPSDGSCNGGN